MIGLSLISIQIDLNCKYAEVPCSCEDTCFYASSNRGSVFGQIKSLPPDILTCHSHKGVPEDANLFLYHFVVASIKSKTVTYAV